MKLNNLMPNINNIFTALLSNADLVKLFYYNSYNPLSESNVADPSILIKPKVNNAINPKQRFFPIPFNDDVMTEQMTTLHIYYAMGERRDRGILEALLYFDIICHQDLWMVSGNIRPYMIMNEISKTLSNTRVAGITKFKFDNFAIVWPVKDHPGYRMIPEIEMSNLRK